MNELYRAVGISKQGFHQHLRRALAQADEQEQILLVVVRIRDDHPRMSARRMYQLVQPQYFGRDRFIALCLANGYRLLPQRSPCRTTDSRGVVRFDNLLVDRVVRRINQVWVSDITYYELGGRLYYLTFILDVYSRRILGACASRTLLTDETTLVVLRQSVRLRGTVHGVILHSDGGGQYYSTDFLAETRAHGIRNSMCREAWENPFAERVNGIIKNEYLVGYAPVDERDLKRKLAKAVHMYNEYRPHTRLHGLSPCAFEESGLVLPVRLRSGARAENAMTNMRSSTSRTAAGSRGRA
jgi:transposase InsO family protein